MALHRAETQRTRLDNYIRTHRKRAGLSQRELGSLLGYSDEGAVARHERSKSLPPFLIAVAYEVIFQKPISELFPGIRDAIKGTIEPRLLRFEAELDNAPKIARAKQKLAWLTERRTISED
jgi:DNA-binding XRE family transcriptional regulator